MNLFDKFKENKIVFPEERRKKNNDYIKNKNIDCLDNLPCIEPSTKVHLKDIDAICKRAIACLFAIQLACDIESNYDYNESKELFSNLLKKYDSYDYLLEREKKLFNNNYTKQDVLDITWSYETYWSLVWALGFIDDIKDASNICDCKIACTIVGDCNSYEEFKSKCKLRNVEEILDMLDLYYRYHWACVEKRINPETKIGNLNYEVVFERRRGLEWLVSDLDDPNDISLDT